MAHGGESFLPLTQHNRQLDVENVFSPKMFIIGPSLLTLITNEARTSEAPTAVECACSYARPGPSREKKKKQLKNDQEPVELNAHFSRQPSSSNARNLFHLKLRKAKFTFFQNERPLLVGHLCQVLCCQFIQFFI